MPKTENLDDALFQILKECKTLPLFLDQIFGFLSRRTDFYHVATEPQSPVGLPKGLAEQTVRQTFQKWQKQEGAPAPKTNKFEVRGSGRDTPKVTGEFTKADSYNGATYETHSWSQTITELDVCVKMPVNTAAKDLKVEIQPMRIAISGKHSNEVIFEGELAYKCKSDAIWSINNHQLEIRLDKVQERWWERLLTSEPALDVSKMDCTRPFDELPEEAQSKIEELQWNQERKRRGLPTSEQMAMESVLKDAWSREGSPFEGAFDPTTVKFE